MATQAIGFVLCGVTFVALQTSRRLKINYTKPEILQVLAATTTLQIQTGETAKYFGQAGLKLASSDPPA